MAITNECWCFLFRIVRSPARPQMFERVALIEITRDEEHAAALCRDWRDDEPDDDVLCVGWRIINGHYCKGSNATPVPVEYNEAYLRTLALALGAPMMQAIAIAVHAMEGDYGDNCDPIRPGATKENDDDEYV